MPLFKRFCYLLLLTVLIVACDSRNCIEPDDFGEWDKDIFNVYARKDLCSGPVSGSDSSVEVQKCLDNGYLQIDIADSNGVTTQRTYETIKGVAVEMQSAKGCKIKIKDDKPYNVIADANTLTGEEKKYIYTTKIEFSNECGDSLGAKEKLANELYQLGIGSCVVKCQKEVDENSDQYAYDKYSPMWVKNNEYGATTGGIKIGNGQSVEIVARGEITLSSP
ncbi:MAG: hypothetical protein LBC92_04115, partial [Rickettsiales bacterium]|nr:hypothetical protein [Rickettsiales bacterium]